MLEVDQQKFEVIFGTKFDVNIYFLSRNLDHKVS